MSIAMLHGVSGEGSNELFKKLVDRSITEVTAEDLAGITKIGDYAFFNYYALRTITLPISLVSVGLSSFNGCSTLKEVVLPVSVRSIGVAAFANCGALVTVIMGNNVHEIFGNAFLNCSSLTSVTINATTPPTLANTNAFSNTNNCPIYVPAESVEAYKAATNWSALSTRIQAIPN